MISDLDLYLTAAILVKHYGEDTRVDAARRVDWMLKAGDLESYGVRRGHPQGRLGVAEGGAGGTTDE